MNTPPLSSNPSLNEGDLKRLRNDLIVKISELKSQIDNLYMDVGIIDNYLNDKKVIIKFKYIFVKEGGK